MKNIEDAMIPASVVKAYLENVLAEWDALGDRKYELPNMQVYNHTRKELDDLEAWIATNCRAATESNVAHTHCEEGVCPICGGDIEYGDFEMHDEGATYDWECPKCGATGKEGYDLTFDGNHYNVCDANGNEVK